MTPNQRDKLLAQVEEVSARAIEEKPSVDAIWPLLEPTMRTILRKHGAGGRSLRELPLRERDVMGKRALITVLAQSSGELEKSLGSANDDAVMGVLNQDPTRCWSKSEIRDRTRLTIPQINESLRRMIAKGLAAFCEDASKSASGFKSVN